MKKIKIQNKVLKDANVPYIDNITSSLSIIPPSILPFEIPDKFINIPQSIFKNVSRYLTIVIETGSRGREVNIKEILENTKNMFRNGPRYHDKYWMQHCASTIRELIVFLEPGHFRKSFSGIPTEGTDPKVESIFSFLNKSLVYLSDVVHFRESAKVGNYDKLYLNQGYGQMSKEDFFQKEIVLFEKVCIHIIYTLDQLFTSYCIGK